MIYVMIKGKYPYSGRIQEGKAALGPALRELQLLWNE